jgi:4-amino-4-deoxy-L-arabinose transferase-like glycosyltransferase
MVVGLFGRDPWKPDEAYTVGVVHQMAQTADWVVPALAGEPFMEKPPLVYASAALFIKAAGNLMAPHEAARLATLLYVALTLVFAVLSARELYGPRRALPCVLVLIGCLGYVNSAHLLITDHGLMAGIAVALYGLAIVLKQPAKGALALGTGAGVAFLSKGLIGPGVIGITCALLAFLPAWQTRRYRKALLLAAAAFAPWALVWPCMLFSRSPELFSDWLVQNNLGRFMGTVNLGPEPDHLMYLRILPWFFIPALPLAAWHAVNSVRAGEKFAHKAEIQLPFVMAAVMLVVLSVAGTSRFLYAMPMLVPLAVLGAASTPTSPQWLVDKVAATTATLGGVVAFGTWAGWLVLFSGWPNAAARWLDGLRPGFVPQFEPLNFLIALSATMGWLALVRWSKDFPHRLAVNWAATVSLAWVLLMSLWISWFNFGSSYRSVVEDIKTHLPAGANCVSSRDLGEPQRAMLHYFAGMLTRREPSPVAKDCTVLLVEGSVWPDELAYPWRWTLLWSGTRPGDARERFWLLTRR